MMARLHRRANDKGTAVIPDWRLVHVEHLPCSSGCGVPSLRSPVCSLATAALPSPGHAILGNVKRGARKRSSRLGWQEVASGLLRSCSYGTVPSEGPRHSTAAAGGGGRHRSRPPPGWRPLTHRGVGYPGAVGAGEEAKLRLHGYHPTSNTRCGPASPFSSTSRPSPKSLPRAYAHQSISRATRSG